MTSKVKTGDTSLAFDWERDIASHIRDIQPVDGGFTNAKRGVVKLASGSKVFVKIATDEQTLAWLKKEIKVYQILHGAGYQSLPKLLAIKDDCSAMAIEYLASASFENIWDKAKLDAVIRAQDELMKYGELFKDDPDFKSKDAVDPEIAWPVLYTAGNLQRVNDEMVKLGAETTLTYERLDELRDLGSGWAFKQDVLIHEDIRADNFGYDPSTKSGKLIDWNWLCLGDNSLDTTPLFINMHLSGFNPYTFHPEKYDQKMLAFLISFWLMSIVNGAENSSERELKLRTAQAKNVDACMELLSWGTSH